MEKNKEDDENHLVEEQKQENGLLLSENEKVLKDFFLENFSVMFV